jgi:hypothetical protein
VAEVIIIYAYQTKLFFEIITEKFDAKPRRMSNREIKQLLNTKAKLSKEQKLLKSVLEELAVTKLISEQKF